jgi:chromosome segregation ATPase
MTDPFDRLDALASEARYERDTARQARANVESELHTVRRQLKRAEEALAEERQLTNQLRRQVERAEQVAENHRRAMLDTAARV